MCGVAGRATVIDSVRCKLVMVMMVLMVAVRLATNSVATANFDIGFSWYACRQGWFANLNFCIANNSVLVPVVASQKRRSRPAH